MISSNSFQTFNVKHKIYHFQWPNDLFVNYLNDSCEFLMTHVEAFRKIKIISINNR